MVKSKILIVDVKEKTENYTEVERPNNPMSVEPKPDYTHEELKKVVERAKSEGWLNAVE